MPVSRIQVIQRGFACCCPNCGQRTLFQVGRWFKVNPVCPHCGLRIENGDGAFLGPFVVNYGLTALGFVIPIILLFTSGGLGAPLTLGLCFLGALVLPILLYRFSWSGWLMLYYFFLPHNLPGNLEGRLQDDE